LNLHKRSDQKLSSPNLDIIQFLYLRVSSLVEWYEGRLNQFNSQPLSALR